MQPVLGAGDAGPNVKWKQAYAAAIQWQPRDTHAILGGPGTGYLYMIKLVVKHALLTRKIHV